MITESIIMLPLVEISKGIIVNLGTNVLDSDYYNETPFSTLSLNALGIAVACDDHIQTAVSICSVARLIFEKFQLESLKISS